MMAGMRAFLNDESGASAAEYALILAIIAAGLAIGLGALGSAISAALNAVGADLTSP
jgi:pilus assembly protein Flp/PilA